MSGWSPRRFWSQAEPAETAGGWGVHLDGRALRTPAKALLAVPTRALAAAIAEEWQAQGAEVAPATMPLTRIANTAIDRVAAARAAVAAEIAAYGGSDLLCYRAPGPAALAARQAAAWDPWLSWAAAAGAPLAVTAGVVPVAQPEASLAALAARVAGQDAFALAALHDLVAISGSLVLGLAVAEGLIDADAAFDLARIDEDWQAAQWGEDALAAEAAASRRQAMVAAGRFSRLCR